MKLKPKGREDPDKVEHRITLYPTAVVLRPDGREVGRIEGYRDPAVFLRQIRWMRRGRTLEELLESVRGPGGTHADLLDVVEGLRDGDDFFRALEILRSFHGREKLSCCRGVTWGTELDLQAALYEEAGPWALGENPSPPAVAPEPSVAALAGIVEAEASRRNEGNRASLVREARRRDTAALGARAPLADLTPRDASEAADRLYAGGDYAGAARLWQLAVAGRIAWGAVEYSQTAGKLLVAGTDLAVAERWAGMALAPTNPDGEKTILGTMLLARIKEARGAKREAAATARHAAKVAVENELPHLAHAATDLARRCAAGEVEKWPDPPFESWPW